MQQNKASVFHDSLYPAGAGMGRASQTALPGLNPISNPSRAATSPSTDFNGSPHQELVIQELGRVCRAHCTEQPAVHLETRTCNQILVFPASKK